MKFLKYLVCIPFVECVMFLQFFGKHTYFYGSKIAWMGIETYDSITKRNFF